MEIQKVDCVSCGAPLSVNPVADTMTCQFCGATLAIQNRGSNIKLDLLQKLDQSIEVEGQQTRNTISEGTRIVEESLTQLQARQELQSLKMQISNIKSEIRLLERGKKSRKIRRQLRELRSEQGDLELNIKKLENILKQPEPGKVQRPSTEVQSQTFTHSPSASSNVFAKKSRALQMGKGCLASVLAMVVLFFGSAVLAALAGTPSGEETSNVADVAVTATLFLGLVVFVDVAFLDWRIGKKLISGTKGLLKGKTG